MKIIYTVPANDFETLNDLEIYQNDNGTYSFSVETIYDFSAPHHQKIYLHHLLSSFCEWCLNNNVDIFYKLDYNTLFNANGQFMSLEELYSYFKALVNGYCYQ